MYIEKYMDLAIAQAVKAETEDEVPIGCVIIKEGKVLGRAYNHKVKKNDATAHSEIECIRKASRKLGTWHLDDCEMYVTLEPCIMCTGAIINSRIRKVYFAAADLKGGALISNLHIREIKGLNHYPDYEFVPREDYVKLLKDFFKRKRGKKKAE